MTWGSNPEPDPKDWFPAFVLGVIALGLIGAGVYFFVQEVGKGREVVRQFCQPRGYVGGQMIKGVGFACIDRNGREFLQREILRAEEKSK